MGILVGLDLGEKRVGLARSDETETIAEPVATITYREKGELLRQLKLLFEEFQPRKIIVGFPITLGGETGVAAKKVIHLVDWLRPRLEGEWILWDERLTSAEAERVLLETNLSQTKRRQVRDRIAAQRILQSYLENQKHV